MPVLSSVRLLLSCLALSVPIVSAAAEISEAAVPAERSLTMALLMPADESPLLAAAKIVSNGIIAASRLAGQPANLLLIEAPSSVPLSARLDAAVVAGADVVIGPLKKDSVEELAANKDLPIPVVALNFSAEREKTAPAYMLMMSASYVLEADDVARMAAGAIPDGLPKKVLILKSAQPWEERVAQAYRTTLDAEGVQYSEFTVTQENLRSVRSLAAEGYQCTLLALDARTAGLVRNLLPMRMRVWATSATNPGDPDVSAAASTLSYDLNNVVFSDSPILNRYNADTFAAHFRSQMPYSVPARELFALGADAYSVAEQFAHGRESYSLDGETGHLEVNRAETALVSRTPAFYVIRDGQIYLADTAEVAQKGTVLPKLTLTPKVKAVSTGETADGGDDSASGSGSGSSASSSVLP